MHDVNGLTINFCGTFCQLVCVLQNSVENKESWFLIMNCLLCQLAKIIDDWHQIDGLYA